GVGAYDRRLRQVLGAGVTDGGVELARRQAAALDVPQHLAGRARCRDRRLAAEPRPGQRALRVDLAYARRIDLAALRGGTQPGGRGAGVDAVDQPHGVAQPSLLHEQALQQLDARVELLVDRLHDPVHRLALLDDLADAGNDLVQPGGDPSQLHDGRDEVVDER